MKLKLCFTLVIVLLTACSKKTLSGGDTTYYRQEMEKSKRLAAEKENRKNIENKVVGPSYLTASEKTKFASMLEVGEEEIENEKLYDIINDWLGTPYNWGGTTKNGVDCSAYVQDVYQKVYDFELPRTSNEQFNYDIKANFKGQEHLQEGDLLFFRLRFDDKVVSHVGIYLQNGKFTGSNSPHGVQIVDLNTQYWQDRFVSGARLLKNQ